VSDANTRAQVARVRALVATQRYDDAAQMLAPILAAHPDDASLWQLLAGIERGRRSFSAALDAIRKAIACSPLDASLHRDLALTLINSGRPRRARSAAEEAVALAPNNAHGWYLLSRARLGARDLSGARSAAEHAAELAPGSAMSHDAVGMVALRERRFGEAEQCFRAGLALAPSNPSYLNNLAITLEAQGRRDDAMALLASAGRSDPRSSLYARNAVASGWRHVIFGTWAPAALFIDRRGAREPQTRTLQRRTALRLAVVAALVVALMIVIGSIVPNGAAALTVIGAIVVAVLLPGWRRRYAELPMATRTALRIGLRNWRHPTRWSRKTRWRVGSLAGLAVLLLLGR
jgi:Flp pilus assembly protein TadD